MKNTDNAELYSGLFILFSAAAGLFGWIYNIYWLLSTASEITLFSIVSVLGLIAAPIGVVTGWVSFLS